MNITSISFLASLAGLLALICVLACCNPGKSAPGERLSSNYAATRIAYNVVVRPQSQALHTMPPTHHTRTSPRVS